MKYFFDNFDKLYDELIEQPFIENSRKSDKMDTHKRETVKRTQAIQEWNL